MSDFVRGLILDLRGRCDILLAELEEAIVNADLKDYANRTRSRILFVKTRLHHLLERLDSKAARYSARNVFFDFKERSNEIQFHEYISVPFVSRYDKHDIYFNRLLRLSCEQTGYPLAMPVGSTLGQAYYYSYPGEGIVVSPFLQAHSLLNLPDMFHELGHIIFNEYREWLKKPFNAMCDRYFSEQKAEAQRLGGAEGFAEIISRIEYKWSGDWLGEFVCDVIGTYLVGEPYGWANLYLCAHTKSSDTVYMPDIRSFDVTVHPSDESRMRAIFSTVKYISPDTSLSDLQKDWSEYISTLGPEKPDHYDFFYPDNLIDGLVGAVIRSCEEIGLHSFVSSSTKNHDPYVVKLIESAWKKFRTDPDGYVAWERENISILRERLGL